MTNICISNHLQEIRESKKLSRLQLSYLTKINAGDISKIERGLIYPYKGWRKRLSVALEVSESELFPDSRESN